MINEIRIPNSKVEEQNKETIKEAEKLVTENYLIKKDISDVNDSRDSIERNRS